MGKREILEEYMSSKDMDYKYFEYEESIHTVEDTVRVAKITAQEVTKSMIFEDNDGNAIRAIVLASDRVSTKRLRKALDIESVSLMESDDVLKRTNYPPGGMPCFGYEAITVVDPKVMEREKVYTGGGTTQSLMLVSSEDILKDTKAVIARIRK